MSEDKMSIWIDGDSCPKEIKEIVYKAAIKQNVPLNYIANSFHKIPRRENFKLIIVDRSFDAADQHIIDNISSQDLVITQDIPLAYEAVLRKAFVISPRGQQYTDDNIREKLAMRDLMDNLRSVGNPLGGPKPLNQKHISQFANALDKILNSRKS